MEQNEGTATSTADPSSGLTCAFAIGKVPACVQSSGKFLENSKSVPLSWSGPSFGQIRNYTIYRANGSFTTAQQVLANLASFSALTTLTGTPPVGSFTDSNVKNGSTYTYFVTDGNK